MSYEPTTGAPFQWGMTTVQEIRRDALRVAAKHLHALPKGTVWASWDDETDPEAVALVTGVADRLAAWIDTGTLPGATEFDTMPPAAEGLPPGALDAAVAGASALDAMATTPYGRNLLAHALAGLAEASMLANPAAPDEATRICASCQAGDHANCAWDEQAPPRRCTCVCPTRAESRG